MYFMVVLDQLDVAAFDSEVFDSIFRSSFEATSLTRLLHAALSASQRAALYAARLEVFNVRAGSTIVEAGIILDGAWRTRDCRGCAREEACATGAHTQRGWAAMWSRVPSILLLRESAAQRGRRRGKAMRSERLSLSLCL